ncbi:MAG: hypothetical protein LBI06_02415 [Treponema sp.]|jgi:hypothetical protein|nr:hypothetical protein [Treponema sp.]
MKKVLTLRFIVLAFAALAFIATGCATTIKFQGERPPKLDTLGIQKLAVMPFIASDGSSLQVQAASLLTAEAQTRIAETNHFTMINPQVVQQTQDSGGNLADIVDALFSGTVVSITEGVETRQGLEKDSEGNLVPYTYYQRNVNIIFNYNLTRARDGSMIGPVVKRDSALDVNRDSSRLETPESMVRRLTRRNMYGLARDVAPYQVTERRTLKLETSSDKAIKERSKSAHAMAKEGNLRRAQEAFINIYRETGSLAAAENVALIYEVQSDLQSALAFLEIAYNDSGSPRLKSEIARLEKAMEDAGLLAAYKENQSQRERVIAYLVEQIPSRLPGNARVAILNYSNNEMDVAESVVNGLLHGLQSKGVTLVDHGNRSLVEAERNYQVSGNVNDDEIARLGNEAGINAFILVSVTGSGGSRRLALRVLDVERSTILYTSPPTDDMNL